MQCPLGMGTLRLPGAGRATVGAWDPARPWREPKAGKPRPSPSPAGHPLRDPPRCVSRWWGGAGRVKRVP